MIMTKKLFILTMIFCVEVFASSPVYNTTSGDLCFKRRNIMYPVKDVFEALKSTLMQSNLNIATVTKKDGVLLAKGSQINANEDTITSITVTVSFKPINDGKNTNVELIANYTTSDKKNDTGQIGASGISLPIPVPFTGKYVMTGSGSINDSLWYQGFFNSLDKLLFENEVKYGKTLAELKAEEETTKN